MKNRAFYNLIKMGLTVYSKYQCSYIRYSAWVKEVVDWLEGVEADAEHIAEWNNIDYFLKIIDGVSSGVDHEQFLMEAPSESDIDQFLDTISMRFMWLAKYRSGDLPSRTSSVLNKIDKKIKIEKDTKKQLLLNAGLKSFQGTASFSHHDQFFVWLVVISDYLETKVPESGLSAEWLSLPVITSYYNGILTNIFNIQEKLPKVLNDRYSWIDEAMKWDVSQQLEEIELNAKIFRATNGQPTLDSLVFTKKRWVHEAYILAYILKEEAYRINANPMVEYVRRKAKTYVDKDGVPYDGDRILNNLDSMISQNGLTYVRAKVEEVLTTINGKI